MPYSTQTFTYEGGARTFTISLALGYIKEADIAVFVVGELDGGGAQIYRTFTFDSEFVVNVTEALDNPSTVTVERRVDPDVFEVDFEAGDDITNRNVMIAFRQNFHLMQEILDGQIDGINVAQRATDAETAATAAIAAQAAAEAAAAGIEADEIILRDGTVAMTAFLTLDGVTPTADAHAASKKYVDDSVGGGGVMLLDGTQQMTAAMDLVAASPTADDHAARKKYVDDADALKADLAGPTLTGVPAAPTAAPGTNTTQLATTAFVLANATGSLDVQTFTASGTWTKPAGAQFVYVEMIGGGGSGGKSGSGDGGGGGGGGAWHTRWFDADDLGGTETVTVGAGGAAQASVSIGNDGGDTTFGSHDTGFGGEAGSLNNEAGGYNGWDHNGYTRVKQYGGVGGAGVVGGPGNDGGNAYLGGAGGGGGGDNTSGGTGGTSVFHGDGGNGNTGAGAATAGSAPGGGGGGVESATNSGAGGDGQCIVYTI